MRLNYIETGSGPSVVLLHGLFGAARNFGVVQRALTPLFRVIAMDARNHGASPHAAGMSYVALAADVLETLDALGVERTAVIGHSMGGKTAMTMAVMAPERVGRLLVADIAPVPYQHGNASIAGAMRAIPLHAGLTRVEADAALTPAVSLASVRAFLVQNLQFGPQPHWRIGLDEIAAAIPDLEGWETPAGSFPGPTLFVSGAQSDYVRPEHRPMIRALFPAARFVSIKNAGHWLHADNPAGFLSVVEAFLHDWKG
jgi:esterase